MGRKINAPHESLEDQITNSLRMTGYFLRVPHEIDVHVDPTGHVSLSGVVPSYYLKQKAQLAVMSVDGVKTLRNELKVH